MNRLCAPHRVLSGRPWLFVAALVGGCSGCGAAVAVGAEKDAGLFAPVAGECVPARGCTIFCGGEECEAVVGAGAGVVAPGEAAVVVVAVETAGRTRCRVGGVTVERDEGEGPLAVGRSEEHTSELQSPYDLVCRL